MGLLLTKVFHFEPEIAAGIILIGQLQQRTGIECNGVSRKSQPGVVGYCNSNGNNGSAISYTIINENYWQVL